jgi:hypothetical protein
MIAVLCSVRGGASDNVDIVRDEVRRLRADARLLA